MLINSFKLDWLGSSSMWKSTIKKSGMDLKLHSRQRCNQSGLILCYFFFFAIMLSLEGFHIFSWCRHEVGLFTEPACLPFIPGTRVGGRKGIEGQTKGKKWSAYFFRCLKMLKTTAQNKFRGKKSYWSHSFVSCIGPSSPPPQFSLCFGLECVCHECCLV